MCRYICVNNVIVPDSCFLRCLPYPSPRGRHFSNGLAACFGNKGAVGSRSCVGLRACELNEGDVGNDGACTTPERTPDDLDNPADAAESRGPAC